MDGDAHPVFTLWLDRVEPGATAEMVTLADGSSIPAICIGEQGRGRSQTILPLPDLKAGRGGRLPRVLAMKLGGSTKRERMPRSASSATRGAQYWGQQVDEGDADWESAIVVCRFAVPEGERRSLRVTSDYAGQLLIGPEYYRAHPEKPGWVKIDSFFLHYALKKSTSRERLDREGFDYSQHYQHPEFDDLYEIYARGRVAQGAAGLIGRAPQLIVQVYNRCPIRVTWEPEDGKPDDLHDSDIFFAWTGEKIIRLTLAERRALEAEGRSPLPPLKKANEDFIL